MLAPPRFSCQRDLFLACHACRRIATELLNGHANNDADEQSSDQQLRLLEVAEGHAARDDYRDQSNNEPRRRETRRLLAIVRASSPPSLREDRKRGGAHPESYTKELARRCAASAELCVNAAWRE